MVEWPPPATHGAHLATLGGEHDDGEGAVLLGEEDAVLVDAGAGEDVRAWSLRAARVLAVVVEDGVRGEDENAGPVLDRVQAVGGGGGVELPRPGGEVALGGKNGIRLHARSLARVLEQDADGG